MLMRRLRIFRLTPQLHLLNTLLLEVVELEGMVTLTKGVAVVELEVTELVP